MKKYLLWALMAMFSATINLVNLVSFEAGIYVRLLHAFAVIMFTVGAGLALIAYHNTKK